MPSRIVCFVCGSLGGEYQLRSRPCEGCAFFPFLEHHDPPKGSRIPGPDGIVDSCRVCYAFLTQQWETYERTNTPAIKRLYWLKRLDDGQFTGAEMKLQGEYMAQVMGLQYQPSCADGCAPQSPDSRDGSGTGLEVDTRIGRKSQPQEDGDRVLDLSVSVKSETVTRISNKLHLLEDKSTKEVTKGRSHVDDFNFVCYTCGAENEGVAAKFISSMPHGVNEPFFPFLTKLTPPKAAAPMSGQGVCQVCDRCFSSLCHQWLSYEHHGTPSSARIFKVNAAFFSNDSNIAMGVVPDTSGEVCCYLCSKPGSSSKLCSLYTAPTRRKADQMYFPFVRELRRPHGARPLNPDGSVLVCVSCFSNLQDQWQRYESEKVPHLQRRYTLLPPSSSSSSSSSAVISGLKTFADSDIKCDTSLLKTEAITKSLTQPLAIEISKSPTFARNHPHSLLSGPTSLSTVTAIGASAISSSATAQEASKQHNMDSKSHTSSAILSIPHPLQQAGERPKKVCFLCGEKCLLNKAQILYSYPVRHGAKNSTGQSQTIPFFPFLANHPPAPGSEPMTEEGVVITCSYCCYSLLNQWRDFEESKGVTDRNRWLRKYTLYEFVCFVCGMMVPRKKMRTLEVQKFLFLKEHKAAPNALVMWGGEAVGACSSCHYSLSHQFTEFERLGLPMELRKYNWTVQHHTEDNNSDTHESNPGLTSAGVNEDSNLSMTEAADDSNHSSPPSNKPFLSLTNLAAPVSSKHGIKPALVLPQNQISPSNGLSASGSSSARTASFAAALRNLAHHAKEPSEDVSEHSLTSPTNHNSRSNTPKRAQTSLVLPPHPVAVAAAASFTSPPVVTVAPMQAGMFSGIGSLDLRENAEKSHMSSFDQWSKPDPDHLSLSAEDAGLAGKDVLLSRSSTRIPIQGSVSSSSLPATSQALNPYARNFHAFRAEEEELLRHGLQLPYGMDHAAFAASAYHPALLQQQAAFSQGSLRLSDSLLLDQYRMLQAPYLSFPTAGLISPHSLGLGVHTMLAAAAASQHYSPTLFPQHYPYLGGLGQPLMDPQAAMLDRCRLDHEKSRDRREKDRNHEHFDERELNHRHHGMGDKDRVKKEHNSSDGFGHRYFEHRDPTSIAVCASSQSPEVISRRHIENYSGHRSSRPNSSMSVSSGHRQESKISPGSSNHSVKPSYDKSHTSLNVNSSSQLGSFESQAPTSPTKGMAFKSHDKQPDPSQPDHQLAQKSTLPILVRSPSLSANSIHDKNKSGSDFTPLFRPFDDPKQKSEPINSRSSTEAHHGQRPWHLENSLLLSAFQHKESKTTGSNSDDPAALSEIHVQTSQDHFSVRDQSKAKPLDSSLCDRIERFDFKSLAQECMSSPSIYQSNLPDSDVMLTTGSRRFLSKLDYEAVKNKERRRRGEETYSDIEKEEERMKARLTMIGRATPIPLETAAPKLELFECLGLITWKRKKELNRSKEMRRRRQLRLSSISPIQHEQDSPHEFGDSFNSVQQQQQLKLGLSLDQKLAGAGDLIYNLDPHEKSEFFITLGLAPLSPSQKTELELLRKYRVEAVTFLQSSRLAHTSTLAGRKRKMDNRENNILEKKTRRSVKNVPPNHFDQHDLKSAANSLQHPHLSDPASASAHSDVSTYGSSLYRDFHGPPGSRDHSLLPGASSSPIGEGLSPKSVPHDSKRDGSASSYLWPGIESVLESYQRFREEQLAESQLLRDRCHQLQAENDVLGQVTHRISRQMAHLMEENQRMLEERSKYQEAIDHLKETLHSIR